MGFAAGSGRAIEAAASIIPSLTPIMKDSFPLRRLDCISYCKNRHSHAQTRLIKCFALGLLKIGQWRYNTDEH